MKRSRRNKRNPFDENPNQPLRHTVLNRRVKGHEKNVGATREKYARGKTKLGQQHVADEKRSTVFMDKRFGEQDVGMNGDEKMFLRFKEEKLRRSRTMNAYNSNDEIVLTHNGNVLNNSSFVINASSSLDNGKGKLRHKSISSFSQTLENSLHSMQKNIEYPFIKEVETEVITEDSRCLLDTAFESLISTKLVEFRPTKDTRDYDYITDAECITQTHDEYDVQLRKMSLEAKVQPNNRIETLCGVKAGATNPIDDIESSHICRMKRNFCNLSGSRDRYHADSFRDIDGDDAEVGIIARKKIKNSVNNQNEYKYDSMISPFFDKYEYNHVCERDTDMNRMVETLLNFNNSIDYRNLSIYRKSVIIPLCYRVQKKQSLFIFLNTLTSNFIRQGNLLSKSANEVNSVKMLIQLNHTNVILCYVSQEIYSYATLFWTNLLNKMAEKMMSLLYRCEKYDAFKSPSLSLGELLLLKLIAHIYCTSDFENAIVNMLSICLCLALKLVLNCFRDSSIQQLMILSIFFDNFRSSHHLPEMLQSLRLYSSNSNGQAEISLAKASTSILHLYLRNQQTSPALSEFLTFLYSTSISTRPNKLRQSLHWRKLIRCFSTKNSTIPQQDDIIDPKIGPMQEYKSLSKAAKVLKKVTKRELQKVSHILSEQKYGEKIKTVEVRKRNRQMNYSMLEKEKGEIGRLKRDYTVTLKGGGKNA